MTGAALSVNDVLLFEHDDGDLSDEELFLLQELNSSSNRNPSFPYWEYEPFNLDSYNEDECWADFRFKKDDLVRVCQAFLINEPIITYNRLKVEPLEALCLMLRRLAFPCRYSDLMLYQSELLEKLNTHSFAPDGSPLCIYGDPAYPFSLHLQTGFKNPTNDQELIFNQKMSGARVTVEWGFGGVIERFRFTDFTKMQILGLNSVGKQYVVSAILSNVKTCLYGCKTADYFGCAPPILENYLNL